MTPSARVQRYLSVSLQSQIEAVAELAEPVARGGLLIVRQLLEGGRILSCGSGGSAMSAQLFAAKMLNRFDRERPELPAIALTADSAVVSAIADEYGYDEVFAKQLRALGQRGDLLLAVSSDGDSESVNAAIQAAHERQMAVIALSGGGGGRAGGLLTGDDVEIRIPSTDAARTEALHLLVIHALCDLIDARLLGEQFEEGEQK